MEVLGGGILLTCLLCSLELVLTISGTVVTIERIPELPGVKGESFGLNLNNLPTGREPISANSTLAQALAVARQFLVKDDVLAAQNVEFFKRPERSGQQEVTERPKKMYSWWQFKKPTKMTTSTTTSMPTPEDKTEAEEVTTTTEFQSTGTPMTSTPSVVVTDKMVQNQVEMKPGTDHSEHFHPPGVPCNDSLEESTAISMTTTFPTSTSTPKNEETTPFISTTKPTRKPRPSKTHTKRPSKNPTKPDKKPSLVMTTTEAPSTNSDQTDKPEETAESAEAGSQGQDSSVTDPFGVKRRLVSLAKTAINRTRNLASSTAEQLSPVAKDAAVQAGIVVLKTASRVGSITKNAAEGVYKDLAKRLNATELLEDHRKNQTMLEATTEMHMNQQYNQSYYDDDDCGGSRVGGCAFTVILGSLILVLGRFL